MTDHVDGSAPVGGGAQRPEGATGPEGAAAGTDLDRRADRAGQGPGDLAAALSPRQILGGFALAAALLLLIRRRRGSRRG